MKKNKKLFAILTLVAFMMTLVPALAFADDVTTTATTAPTSVTAEFVSETDAAATYKVTATWANATAAGTDTTGATKTITGGNGGTITLAKDAVTGFADVTVTKTAAVQSIAFAVEGTSAASVTVQAGNAATTTAAWTAFKSSLNQASWDAFKLAQEVSPLVGSEAAKAAAVADADSWESGVAIYNAYNNMGTINNADSSIATVKANVEIDEKTENAKVHIDLVNAAGTAATDTVYVWAEARNNEVSPALGVSGTGVMAATKVNGLYKVTVAGGADINVSFLSAGTYTLHAAAQSSNDVKYPSSDYMDTEDLDLAKVNEISSPTNYSTVKVNAVAGKSSDWTADVVYGSNYGHTAGTNIADDKTTDLGKEVQVSANNVATTDVKVTLKDKNGNAVKGQSVTLGTSSSNIEVNEEKLSTNYKGEIEFSVSGSYEGDYYITLEAADYNCDILVKVAATSAVTMETTKSPSAPIALDTDLKDEIRVKMYDINGNVVTNGAGATNALNSNKTANNADRYVSFVEKPSASKLTDKDIYLTAVSGKDYYNVSLASNKYLDAEGTYTIKAALDNGNYVTVTFEVKKFQTPVKLSLNYFSTVELGGTINPDPKFVDANGTTKSAKGSIVFAGNGYAIKTLGETSGALTVKNDEKYVGETITVTAVAERYNLVASQTIKVANEAQGITFEETNCVINDNNKVTFKIVDADGTKVALGNDVTIDKVQVVVLDKSNEDAKISASFISSTSSDLKNKGEGQIRLTSNVAGKANVQVIVRATKVNNANEQGAEVKYYTGTQEFTFGNKAGNKTQVVMSIGSHELVKNGVVSTIDAAPMIQDNRTFVPFRALAEAFGATVEFDATNNTVTAKLNGTTVVMTIGSSVMTVGDEAKTLDVAPFISGDRTMVPVRAVAEAFGFNVEATSNPDGTTADVVFTK